MTHTESQSAGQGHTTTYNSTDSYQISQLANPSASPSLLEPPPKSLVASQNRWRLGLILLSIVIILWVASGFLVSVSLHEFKHGRSYRLLTLGFFN